MGLFSKCKLKKLVRLIEKTTAISNKNINNDKIAVVTYEVVMYSLMFLVSFLTINSGILVLSTLEIPKSKNKLHCDMDKIKTHTP